MQGLPLTVSMHAHALILQFRDQKKIEYLLCMRPAHAQIGDPKIKEGAYRIEFWNLSHTYASTSPIKRYR